MKIDDMDSLLRNTEFNLAKQEVTLKNLFLQLCDVNQQSLAKSQMMKIENSIRRNVDFMMELLSDRALSVLFHITFHITRYFNCVWPIRKGKFANI